MAFRMGLLGKKVGMTQTFDKAGNWLAVTVVEAGPCVVLDVHTEARDGYSALKLGFDPCKPSRVNRPEMGLFTKAQTAPQRVVREIRLTADELAQFQVGQTIGVGQVFDDGELVDIVGTSRGKGFQGVMKRHHFSGFRATHGTHEYFRHGGSIGCRLTPGRVFKGMRMPGQLGNARVTVQNVRIYEVIPERNLILLRGAVPGAPGGDVLIQHAAKRLAAPFELRTPAVEAPSEAGADSAAESAPASA